MFYIYFLKIDNYYFVKLGKYSKNCKADFAF
jgi:hypothetical protein